MKRLQSPVLNIRRLAARRLAKTADGRSALDAVLRSPIGQANQRIRHEAKAVAAAHSSVDVPAFSLKDIDLADPFQLSWAASALVRQTMTADSLPELLSETRTLDPAQFQNRPREIELRQIAILLAARARFPTHSTYCQRALGDPLPSIRRLAVQWVGEEKLVALRPAVETVLASEPMTTELFMACLASLSLLDGVAPAEFEKNPPAQYILAIVKDVARPASLRAMALRMLSPSQKELDAGLLGEMLASKDTGLRREAVRTLQHSPIPERTALLRTIAADASQEVHLRADAVAGLAGVNPHVKLDDATRDLLIKLALSETDVAIRLEAIRSLRGSASSQSGDARVAEALKKIAGELSQESAGHQNTLADALAFANGSRQPVLPEERLAEVTAKVATSGETESVELGRRTFFHTNGAGCYKCHMVSGRGGQVGPDLTVIARTMDRTKLAQSILEPNKEISPQFTTWAIETINGKVLTGMLLGEEVNGDLKLGNNQGEVFHVPFNEIETRSPLKTSIMPEKLHDLMTREEFSGLIAFLETLK